MKQLLTSEQIMTRGQGAQRLLADQASREAMAALEDDFTEAWANTNPADVAGREDLWRMYRAVGLLRAKLESYRDNAKVEDFAAEQRKRDAAA